MNPTVARVGTVLSVLLADARRHRLQTATSLAGVAVGVAVVVAIHLASEAALGSFRQTYGSLAGAATHQVTGVTDLPAARLAELIATPGVVAAQPVVESTVALPGAAGSGTAANAVPEDTPRTLRVFGIDPLLAGPFLGAWAAPGGGGPSGDGNLFERFLLEPGLALVPPGDLARLGLPGGGALEVAGPTRPSRLQCLPLDLGPDAERWQGAAGSVPFALVDLATAQELLELDAGLTRIDLILAASDDHRSPDDASPGLGAAPATDAGDELAARLPLGPGERVERPQRRGERAGSLTAAFRSNLLALGFLAVLVGSFLVFNMAQFAVTRRRTLLGKLRCLGCPARTLLTAVLLEAAVLGLLGGALGLALGRWLSTLLVGGVALTVSTLYGFIETPGTGLDAATAAGGLALAVGSSVLATWMPARAAARTPPALVVGAAPPERLPGRSVPLLLALAAAVALLPPRGGLLLQAAAVLFLLLTVATLVPRVLGRLVRRPPPGMLPGLAAGRIQRSLGRTGATAGALVMPLAMTVGITVMIGSFQREVEVWVDATVGADVYVKPLYQELAPRTARLDENLLAALETWPGVAEVDLLRSVEVRLDDGARAGTRASPGADARGDAGSGTGGGHEFLVAGSRLGSLRARDGLRMLEGPDTEEAFARLEAGEVLVSEPLQRKTGLGAGDELVLAGRDGERGLRVAGVFQDFSFDRGYCLMEEQVYLDLYGETGVRNAALILAPGVSGPDVARDLSARFPGAEFDTPDAIHANVMRAFDDTFRVTWSLQAISTALALVGVLTGLLCMHLERRHELGVLRALGATTATVGRLVLLEALVLSVVVALLAVPVGALLAWILIDVVNARSFGWTFPLVFAWGEVAALLGLAVVAALAAGVVPWLLVRRERIAGLLSASGAALLLPPVLALGLSGPARAQDPAQDPAAQSGARADPGAAAFVADPATRTPPAAGQDAGGFLRALPGRPVSLPADHAAHPAARTEWWYLTGPLTTDDGEELGFQATWFRRALRPDPAPAGVPGPDGEVRPPSPLRASALLMFHGNLSDLRAGRMTSTTRTSRDYAPWAHARDDALDLGLFGNTLTALDERAGRARMAFEAGRARLTLELDLSATAPLRHGDDEGLSPKGHELGQASWYYSLPRIPVTGTLERPGRAAVGVTGRAWFDHEFGSSVLSDDQVGWDWFSVALDDGSDLMAFELRRADSGRDTHSAGTLRTPDGRVLRLEADDFMLRPTDTWTSPTGTTYPAGWELSVPAADLLLEVTPRLADQEVRGEGAGVAYWEGLCRFEGTRAGRSVSGQGYVELVGYDGPFSARF